MLIMSQNKQSLYKLEEGETVFFADSADDENNSIVGGSTESSFDLCPLGHYKTKQRALAVLQEIFSSYANGTRAYAMPEE